MADKTYWLGELVGNKRVGGIKVGGKLYAIGEPFPSDKVDSKKLAGFKKSGCIGSVPFKVADPVAEDAKAVKITALLGRVSELEGLVKADGDTIAGLELELEDAGDNAALKIQVAELEPECKRLGEECGELNRLIDEMKDGDIEVIADLKTDNEEKAALIKELKAEVKELKKESKK